MRQILVNFSCFVLALLLSSQIYGQSPPDPSDGSLRDTRLDEVDAKKQLQAVASRTLTWLTGSSEQNAYVSVGRLANFFGFIKFRVASGHSLTRSSAGQETYALLTESQRKRLVELHAEQMETLQNVVLARQQVNHSLESRFQIRDLDGGRWDRPVGADHLTAHVEIGGRVFHAVVFHLVGVAGDPARGLGGHDKLGDPQPVVALVWFDQILIKCIR